MLTISYILTAGLELAVMITIQQMGLYKLIWVYGFLLITSILSVTVENSAVGQRLRKELNEAGIKIEKYDLWGNIGRCIIYLLVMYVGLEPTIGAFFAYAVVVVGTILATKQLS